MEKYKALIAGAKVLLEKINDPSLSGWQKVLAFYTFISLMTGVLTTKAPVESPVDLNQAHMAFASGPVTFDMCFDHMEATAAAGNVSGFIAGLMAFLQQLAVVAPGLLQLVESIIASLKKPAVS